MHPGQMIPLLGAQVNTVVLEGHFGCITYVKCTGTAIVDSGMGQPVPTVKSLPSVLCKPVRSSQRQNQQDQGLMEQQSLTRLTV
jgi:hypothetical protein